MGNKRGPQTSAKGMFEQAQEMITADLMAQMLRMRAVETDDLATLLDLVALGLTNGTWRNSCVENWHAEGRLSDGEMMRLNSHTTHLIRQRLRGWSTELRLTSGDENGLADVTVHDVEALASRIYKWVTNPERRLPTGGTLRSLARTADDLEEYGEHAGQRLGDFVAQMESKGVRFGLLRTGSHGALACNTWWGHPEWPTRVERFLSVLDDPSASHWGPDGEWRRKLPAEPAIVQHREALHSALLDAPWDLDTETTEWITGAGIGYIITS